MNEPMKRAEDLTINDIKEHPVWEYVNEDERGETLVRPVAEVPLNDLYNKIVGTELLLNNRTKVWALIENIDVFNARMTSHFMSASIERAGVWFTLSRYHDVDYDSNGPNALAQFLQLGVGDIFPMYYDVSLFSRGNPDALSGQIPKEPHERLSRGQLIQLALSK